MTPELLQRVRDALDELHMNWAEEFYKIEPEAHARYGALRDELAALAAPEHAAPSVKAARLAWHKHRGASGLTCPTAAMCESFNAGFAAASVSPQAPTAQSVNCAFGEGVVQGGTAEGADWVKVPRIILGQCATMLEHGRCVNTGEASKSYENLRDELRRYIAAALSAAPRPDTGEGLVEAISFHARCSDAYCYERYYIEVGKAPLSHWENLYTCPACGKGFKWFVRYGPREGRLGNFACDTGSLVEYDKAMELLTQIMSIVDSFQTRLEAARALGEAGEGKK